MNRTLAILSLALALAGGIAAPAWAHKVVAGAYASGNHIEGEVGFSDGSVAKNALVEVLGEDGTRLGEVRTGEDGTFVFTPSQRVVHIFHADLGGGHVGSVRLEVADLPAWLAGAPARGTPTFASEAQAGTPDVAAAALALTEAQRTELAEAVHNEIRPLRHEIIAMKEKNDLQSILGGIGYIIGLFGIGFYLVGRQRFRKA